MAETETVVVSTKELEALADAIAELKKQMDEMMTKTEALLG